MSGPSRRGGRKGASRASSVRLPPALMRPGIRQIGRRVLDPALPWEVQRRRFDQVMRTSLMPRGTRVTASRLDGVPAEVVTAAAGRTGRTVVHFHGGGYCLGSARMVRTWAARLSAQAGCRVVVPEYRLAPAHACPAALDDARAVLDTLLREADPASIVVSGDSAGGGLALSLLLALRDAGGQVPAGCILMSPWLDLTVDRWARPALVRRTCCSAHPGWRPAPPPTPPPHNGPIPRSHPFAPVTMACRRC